jgi:hypothetical protein
VARWLITFGALAVVGSLLSPWLHALGLAQLPLDVLVDLAPGYHVFLPLTTSALSSSVFAAVHSLLTPDPPAAGLRDHRRIQAAHELEQQPCHARSFGFTGRCAASRTTR